MIFKFKHTEKIVGLFIFFAVLILVAGIISVSIYKNVFTKKYIFKTKLENADGLSTSTKISFKGYEIGKVKKFQLDSENNIDAQIIIYGEFREKIVYGSAIYRQVNPISGSTSLILLYPNQLPRGVTNVSGSGMVPLPEGNYIPSLDMREGKELLQDKIVEKSGDSISILFEDARDFVSNLRQEVRLKQDSFQTFFQNIADFANSLAENRKVLDYATQLMEPKKGPVFGTLNQYNDIATKLKGSIDRLNIMIENYKTPDGMMIKMFQIDQNELSLTLRTLNENLKAFRDILLGLKEQSPLMAELLDKSNKTLEALNNNPLLRGGISKEEKNTSASTKKRMDIEK